jgi:hypothetical protein
MNVAPAILGLGAEEGWTGAGRSQLLPRKVRRPARVKRLAGSAPFEDGAPINPAEPPKESGPAFRAAKWHEDRIVARVERRPRALVPQYRA